MGVDGLVVVLVVGVVVLLGIIVGLRLITPVLSIGAANQLRSFNAPYCSIGLKPIIPGLYDCPPCLIYQYGNRTYSDCPEAALTVVRTVTVTITNTTALRG
ncbi:hypothetical protein [Caldivirga sp.]|uniref:hypothetical protein n=1 Tax=Caldivirga sp. TaxID=2080243 RepID=UPI003D11478F